MLQMCRHRCPTDSHNQRRRKGSSRIASHCVTCLSRPKVLSEATVLHVRTIAATLGYVPNEVASALSTGRYANMVEVLYRINHTKT
jgi:hypothetical protein